MACFKDIARRRARRLEHEKSRYRLKLGVQHAMEIDTRVPVEIEIGLGDELVDAESAPLRVALAERMGR
jgi:hypothetical protein